MDMYVSTKTYHHNVGLSSAFRQWRADSHCKYLHGYALAIKFVFQSFSLDERNWVVDFGSLKGLKGWIEDTFDHKTLVARDDPEFEFFEQMHERGIIQMVEVESTGCESFAKLIFEVAELWLKDNGYSPRVTLRSVEVMEHGANSAVYEG